MAVNTTGLWTTNTALSVIVRARLIEFADRSTVIGNLFTVDDTGAVRGLVHGIDIWPDLSGLVQDITEGTDEASQTLTPTNVQITPAVVGMLAEITDLLAGSTPFSGLDPYLRQMASAVAEELDDDLAGLFTALNSGTAAGSTGVNADLDDVLDGMVILQTAQAPQPYFGVGHPRQIADIALSAGGFISNVSGAASAGTTTGSIMDRLGGTNGSVGAVAGIPWFSSARCPTVNAAADRGGVMASPDALTVSRKWGIKTETDR